MPKGRQPDVFVSYYDTLKAADISMRYREKFKFTKRALADMLGTHPSFIGNIEAQKGQRPSRIVDAILRLEPMLKRTPEYI